ncbi:hypothetical protein ACGFZ9_43870 [Streptomyces mirabilis]|uniref:hypothetical protein n=1 Tax=Streptomyces mirabilis TaxID=68239 RepID=UPI0037206C16
MTVDVLHECCAGPDVSKKDAKACVPHPEREAAGAFTAETTTWGSTTSAARWDRLLAAEVTMVVIVAASDHWKAFS